MLEFSDKIKDTKVLQHFLGLLNYSRKFIPNLGSILRPLYDKLSKNGQK